MERNATVASLTTPKRHEPPETPLNSDQTLFVRAAEDEDAALRRRLAVLVAGPKPIWRRYPTTANDTVGCSRGVALSGGTCVVNGLAPWVLAIDADTVAAVKGLFEVEEELARRDIDLVLEGSGGELRDAPGQPSMHGWAIIEDPKLRATMGALAKARCGGDAVKQSMRTPLSQHRFPDRVVEVISHSEAEVERLLTPSIPRAKLQAIFDAHKATRPKRKAKAKRATGSRRAGWAKRAAAQEPNVGKRGAGAYLADIRRRGVELLDVTPEGWRHDTGRDLGVSYGAAVLSLGGDATIDETVAAWVAATSLPDGEAERAIRDGIAYGLENGRPIVLTNIGGTAGDREAVEAMRRWVDREYELMMATPARGRADSDDRKILAAMFDRLRKSSNVDGTLSESCRQLAEAAGVSKAMVSRHSRDPGSLLARFFELTHVGDRTVLGDTNEWRLVDHGSRFSTSAGQGGESSAGGVSKATLIPNTKDKTLVLAPANNVWHLRGTGYGLALILRQTKKPKTTEELVDELNGEHATTGKVATARKALNQMVEDGLVVRSKVGRRFTWRWVGTNKLGKKLHAQGRIDRHGRWTNPYANRKARHELDRRRHRAFVDQLAARRAAHVGEVVVLADGVIVDRRTGERIVEPERDATDPGPWARAA